MEVKLKKKIINTLSNPSKVRYPFSTHREEGKEKTETQINKQLMNNYEVQKIYL